MAFIWSEYSSKKKYRVSSVGTSPYLEVWNTTEDIVLVNMYIRLFEILVPRHYTNSAEQINALISLYETDERYMDIVNTFLHFLARQDRKCGMTLYDFCVYNVRNEIVRGCYGTAAKENFDHLTREDQLILCRYLVKYNMTSGREMQLDAVIKALFHDVVIYYERSADVIHVCINRANSDYNSRLFELVCRFFKDIDINVEVYWQKEYFGIIGVEDTMRIGRLALI